MISAGEASGEAHAAALIQALKGLDPGLSFYGMGGEAMAAVGAEVIVDSSTVSTLGFAEVLPQLRRILGSLKTLRQRLRTDRPRALILIDVPEFNLRLAKTAKRAGVPVIYYIPPQVWAWRKGRVKTLARLCDQLIVIFPFEEEFYSRHGVKAFFCGHPFAEYETPSAEQQTALRREIGLDDEAVMIGLLPGSRRSEIKYLLGALVETARTIKAARPEVEFVLPLAPGLDEELVAGRLDEASVRLTRRPAREVLSACRAALVCSGTATLEAAVTGTPMVVVYRGNPISYALARLVIRGDADYVAMPNLIAGDKVVPVMLQGAIDPKKLTEALLPLLDDGPRREEMLAGLAGVRRRLGRPGAARRAAEKILEVLDED